MITIKHRVTCTVLGVMLLALTPPIRAADGDSPWSDPGSPSASRSDGSPVLKSLDPDMPVVPLTYPFPKPKKHKGAWDLDFRHLACFEFEPPSDPRLQRNGERKRIPWEVQSWDGELVRIRGFMMPINQDAQGRTTECVVVRSMLACCYGEVPAPNEWILVTVKSPGALVFENVPLYFYGRLQVGEIYEEGMFAGLYQLDCDKVTMGE